MKSPYKIKHWSPVKKIPKSVDGWGNVLEWEDVEADEYGIDSMKLYYMFMEYLRTLDSIPKNTVYMYNAYTKTFEPARYTNDAPLGQRLDGTLVEADEYGAEYWRKRNKTL